MIEMKRLSAYVQHLAHTHTHTYIAVHMSFENGAARRLGSISEAEV